MGLAGSPHCAAMCGAACAAVARRQSAGFHAGRLLGYAAAGAVVAASVSAASQLGQASAVLRPLWLMLHVAALLLGLSLLWRGGQPAWMMGWGRGGPVHVDPTGGRWAPMAMPLRAGAAGLAWVAWPCGLLQSALVLAALASGPVWGAAVMGGFALSSGLGLLLGPALLWRLLGARNPERGMRLATRVAGLALATGSAWALGHGLWEQVAAFCGR